MQCFATAAVLTTAALAAAVQAAPIGLDGVIGAEWTGVTPEIAVFDAGAPTSNFGSPTNLATNTGYSIYLRSDASYVYVGLDADNNAAANSLPFANLYFATDTSTTGANIGFEVLNNNAFKPGVPGYYAYNDITNDIHFNYYDGTLEFAVPVTFFTADPLGMGFNPASASVTLRLSQSFSYSVIGGTESYGEDRLGTVAVPEPASFALLALGGAALLARKQND